MRFSNVKAAVISGLALCTGSAFSAVTAVQMKANIEALTTKSQNLQEPARQVDLISPVLLIVGLGPFPKLIIGFTDIVVTATGAISQMKGSQPIPAGPTSDMIFEAFREFVRVHQILLNILIGKTGILTDIPLFGAPVAVVLRQVENIVDTIAFGIIDIVQGRKADFKKEAGSLKITIDATASRYEGKQVSAVGVASAQANIQAGGTVMVKRGHGTVVEAAA